MTVFRLQHHSVRSRVWSLSSGKGEPRGGGAGSVHPHLCVRVPASDALEQVADPAVDYDGADHAEDLEQQYDSALVVHVVDAAAVHFPRAQEPRAGADEAYVSHNKEIVKKKE